ncbi:MAG: P-II family nitrogen regulator [Thermoleophilia bacterium]|nr:P-II family nitrogen regulator [Thermoleophilia bacterium]
MMKVEAVVVRDRIETVIEAVGHGREKGITHEYRGRVFESRFLPKALMTFVVPAGIVDGVIDAIVDAARTGRASGDGICWASPVGRVTHNRTGARLGEVGEV